MANQITDNRVYASGAGTNADAESATPYDNLAGAAASPTLDDEIFIENSSSVAFISADGPDGLLFDAGSTQDWSNSHFYFWLNCGIVGLLESKDNGGATVRFCGSVVTDWFEFNIGGNDSWPQSVEGGWTNFVVDIEASANTVNGSTPASNVIRYVGIKTETIPMPRHADNTWVDAIWRLPDGNPGIIVEGSAGSGTPWDFQDIQSQLGTSPGIIKTGAGGSFILNTPLQIGIDDGTQHWFADTNKIILWDDQEFVSTGFYKLSALGSATNLTLGEKTGSGDDATGAQGCVFVAEASSARFDIDFSVSTSAVGIYGCQFQHADGINIQGVSANDFVGNTFVDCASARISRANWVRNNVVAAPTSTGVAFAHLHNLEDIAFNTFQHSSGHAIELLASATGIGNYASTQPNTGNEFLNYGASATTEAAIFNNTASGVTINVTDLGDTPSIRNGTGASTNVQNAVNLQVNVIDQGGGAVASAQTAIFDSILGTQYMNEDTDVSGIAQATFNFISATAINIRVRKSTPGDTRYFQNSSSGQIGSGGFESTVTLIEDTTASS